MTLADVGALMQWSISTVQRLEVGKTDRIRVADVEALCRIYEFSAEFTDVLKGLARQAAGQSWWHEYGDLIPEHFDVFVDLESSAGRITTYEPEIVPGIVQTPAYAGVLIRSVYPDDSPEEHERRVRLRIRRQVKVTRKARPVVVSMVLRESVLHGKVGDHRVVAAQLRRLADLAGLPNVSINILPFSAGFPLGAATGPFVLLEPKDQEARQAKEPAVVYVENFTGDLFLEKESAVQRYAEAYRILLDAALSATESKDLLRRVAKGYAP
ncbi:helix-turn-helix domain-containing protein [Nocardia sp. NBC_01329]|uniref:helix-turn-helix domain-containing protein n=1 Tax=Nocardia sp. NBC_01329 TaxID=2903594 RepID=UPI002E0EF415|nr:helix-turn-helix domain-containing protein [Nocardia sp. NBC_01329]